MAYGINTDAMAQQIIADAANIRAGENPSYTVADFLSAYPQFGTESEPLLPAAMLTAYVALAHAAIKEARWRSYWKVGMGLFIAHFSTLYLQAMTPTGASAKAVVAAGQARGLTASKAAGDVSMSYESIAADLDGWAAWKLTVFGQQLATIGKLVGKGGMYVW